MDIVAVFNPLLFLASVLLVVVEAIIIIRISMADGHPVLSAAPDIVLWRWMNKVPMLLRLIGLMVFTVIQFYFLPLVFAVISFVLMAIITFVIDEIKPLH